MTTNTKNQSICTVTALAKKIGLSRARFYQLQKKGVFPKPLYSGNKQPYYSIELQNICLKIRETGIGCNGAPIIFYAKQENPSVKTSPTKKMYREISEALEQMGLKVPIEQVKGALTALYPDEQKKLIINGDVIAEVFRHLRIKQ